MLELKNIRKMYGTEVEALKGVSIKFRESEFVSILGQSGCGKTTLLNIIGGLDRYTSGDLIINGKSTKKFKDRDWDAYRNYKVGFVFQSYNLISHQTVLSNVELALTIGGISKKERTKRAIKALEEVGLKDQIHKKPNQLSGGQMQRVAIARALVNNPDIILADEPTGALDTKTSVQVMEILKKISKDKLIIMVTHNPDLAQKYSTRIIKILDGEITEDSNPIKENEEQKIDNKKIGRTSMSFFTAFRLSLNNLLTKKTRTILVAFAGSIGIIGIALIQAVSNGFQNYVDSIQEYTLKSYPLTIMQESTDITGTLLSMTSKEGNKGTDGEVKEEQYITSMLSNLSTNDLKSFKKNLEDNYGEVENDISTIKYSYSVDPNIYTIDKVNKLAKLNPSNLFNSMFGSSSMLSTYSAYASIYSQMIDDKDTLNESYDILAGRWPEKYDEMIIVLSEPNSISDLLVYSLGLRDTDELTTMITKIMSGETVDINNEPLTFTYEDLMNVDLRLIMPADTYKYNSRYDIFEDMSEDKNYMQSLYDNGLKLKIVGIVSAKEGVTSMALNPGVNYTSGLIDYIINNSKEKDIVKKQLANPEVDVISGSRFDSKEKNSLDLNFEDFISIDNNMLKEAFDVSISQEDLKKQTEGYMVEIANVVSTDTSKASEDFSNGLNTMANGILKNVPNDINENSIDSIVENYLNGYEASSIITSLEGKYIIPKESFKMAYSGLLKGLLQMYINANETMKNVMNNPMQMTQESQEQGENISPEMQQKMNEYIKQFMQNPTENMDISSVIIPAYLKSTPIQETINTMARVMTEAVMKKNVLTKVGELTEDLTNAFASSFNVDESKISKAFKVKVTEDEITRIVKSMMTKTEKTAKTNLISFGYQDKKEPTYISFYFNSFDGKEHFMDFIDDYNKKVIEAGEEDKEINYTDTTGILMNSVKTIVNAVTYVLIAFVSISLVVSSIMIGVITYISVYERTKEIGILRAIGASKRNISSIFNAETFIIGLLSGLIGIGITYSLIPIINSVLHHFAGNIPLNATLTLTNATVLIVLSVILTLIGGIIPSKAASKKDPVIALRTE
ncbi:MAG: ABC transporter ATP-binding protein/permease [Clostridia bacterium]|nr:ABC transporter ATP-binding protein/permease [Clostridia bacterium]